MQPGTNNAIVQPQQSPRKKSLRMAGLQSVCVGVTALGWFLFGKWTDGFLALAGGAAQIVPALLLAMYLFATLKPGAGKRLAVMFGIGELVKLVVMGLVLGYLIAKVQNALLPTLSGFAAAMLGYWLAPLFMPVD